MTLNYHVTSQPPTVARLRSFTWSNDTPQQPHFVSTPFILLGRFRRFPAEGHLQSISSCRLGFLYRETILMDLEYRNLLAPNGPPLFPSDFRSPRLPRPAPGEFLQRSPESGEMEKTPPVTGKRRGGSRKACNECKQQKVSHRAGSHAAALFRSGFRFEAESRSRSQSQSQSKSRLSWIGVDYTRYIPFHPST